MDHLLQQFLDSARRVGEKAAMPGSSIDPTLSDSEIRDFFEVGWVARRGLFGTDEIRRIRACFDGLERIAEGLDGTGPSHGSHFVLGQKDGNRVIKRVVWAGGSQPYLLDIGADARLVVPASQLLGSAKMDQLLCQAHFKRPGDGVTFGWHQDIQHRDKGPGTWDDINGRGS